MTIRWGFKDIPTRPFSLNDLDISNIVYVDNCTDL